MRGASSANHSSMSVPMEFSASYVGCIRCVEVNLSWFSLTTLRAVKPGNCADTNERKCCDSQWIRSPALCERLSFHYLQMMSKRKHRDRPSDIVIKALVSYHVFIFWMRDKKRDMNVFDNVNILASKQTRNKKG